MTKKVKPLDPSRMRLRRPGERSMLDVAQEIVAKFGRTPEAAERVREQLALAAAEAEGKAKTIN